MLILGCLKLSAKFPVKEEIFAGGGATLSRLVPRKGTRKLDQPVSPLLNE
jgi:hypothetical protein